MSKNREPKPPKAPVGPTNPSVKADNQPAKNHDAAVVSDIVIHDSDELLEPQTELSSPKSLIQKGKDLIVMWRQNRKLRYLTLLGLGAAIILIAVLPVTRYGLLNAVNVRAGMSLTVLDATTQLPLKNAQVVVGNQTGQTDDNGFVKLSALRLGPQTVTVSKIAFASLSRHVVLGWGSNALGSTGLKAVGAQYSFIVTDFLSGKPVIKADAASGQASAFSDSQGKIVLTVNATQASTISVTIEATNYRPTSLNFSLSTTTPTTVQLVPAGKDIFVSNALGHFDVYKVDLDGTNQQLLLAASGNENSNITLAPSPDQKKVALIATRDNLRDTDGYLLYSLVLIDSTSGSSLTLDHGEHIQAIDWIGSRLIYEETASGASAANSQRSRIMSYDYTSNTRLQLATANQFNTVSDAKGSVYYAVSSTDPGTQPAYYSIGADGSKRQQIFSQEVWTSLRYDYNTLNLQTASGWYSFAPGASGPTFITAPSNLHSVSFLDSPDTTHSLWSDYRDGKGVLLVHDIRTNKDSVVQSQEGLGSPFVWINNEVAIYRISRQQETADYVIDIKAGTAHKITDVTNTFGPGQG